MQSLEDALSGSLALRHVTASKLDLAVECLHWATLDLPEDPPHQKAWKGTAFHDLVAFGAISVEAQEHLSADTILQVERMFAVWERNGKKKLPPFARFEVAFVLEPDGRAREIGEKIGRDYAASGAVGICGTLDVLGDLEVDDFKTGRKRFDADEAWQLRWASVVTGRRKTAFHYISSDGKTTVDAYERTPGMVEQDRRRLVVLMDDLASGNTDPIVGSHCRDLYCPARHQCTAYRDAYAGLLPKTPTTTGDRTMGKMTLDNVKKGRLETPLCLVLYGPEGIGKSSFAMSAPNPIFLDPDNGTEELDLKRFPLPDNYQECLEALDELDKDGHDYQTIVIDTADAVEAMIHKFVCEQNGKGSIEDFGYGKGYTAALDEWRVFLAKLSRLRFARKMNVIVLAHSVVKTFRNPAGDDYDRYELNLHGKTAKLLKEWSKAILFTNFQTFTKKEKDDKKVIGVGDGSRIVYTEHRPAWDAKNRYGLPFKLPLDWAEFERAAAAGEPVSFEEISAEIAKLVEAVDAKTKEQAGPAIQRCGKDPRKLSQLADWLRSKAATSNKQEAA